MMPADWVSPTPAVVRNRLPRRYVWDRSRARSQFGFRASTHGAASSSGPRNGVGSIHSFGKGCEAWENRPEHGSFDCAVG